MSRHLSWQQEQDVISLLRRSGVSEEKLLYTANERENIRGASEFLGLPMLPFMEEDEIEEAGSLRWAAIRYRIIMLERLKKLKIDKGMKINKD